MTGKTKVYFNSACPVCDAGIARQRQRLGATATDARSGTNGAVEWIDVHADNRATEEIGADLEFVRERLHAVDETGQILIGSEAFRVLWQITPGQRWRATMTGLPIVRPLFRIAYNWFAAGLYRWNRRRGRW